jgi:hypothetical protein
MKHQTLVFALVVLVAVIAACAGWREQDRHPLESSKLWKQYEALPDEKALAIAGDPVGLWVGGAAGGYDTPTRARHAAIAQCKKQRIARRTQHPCLIYAKGLDVVWVAR